MSAALTLLRHVWQNHHTTAWEALNHCMSDAVSLAIGSKMEWSESDFSYIAGNFRPSYWLGEHGWANFYALAVWLENTSFIKAYESHFDFAPYFCNEIKGDGGTNGFSHVCFPSRKRGRVCLGARVFIGGEPYACTSINNERVVFTTQPQAKKRSVRRMTREDCARLWPAPKKPKKVPQPSA